MNVKKPLRPLPRADISNPSYEDLVSLALMRMRDIVEPNSENAPPRLFPLAESMRWDFFTFDDWKEFGDLETERGRLTYTLSRYPERGAPSSCEYMMRNLLSQTSVLAGWKALVTALKQCAVAALEDVSKRQRSSATERGRTIKSDFLTVPVDYEVSKSASELSLWLWKRSLGEIATELADGRLTGGEVFLQIHAFLKDPIYGFDKPFKVQHLLFKHLLTAFQTTVRVDALCLEDLERVAAQAAQESSYIASPLLEKISLIHFHAHHQLPYANVLLDSLARAEFSAPRHVLEVVEEMLLAVAANYGQACPLVPILVTTRPSFSENGRSLTPIIDGNHRATASILLRFLANQPLLADREVMSQYLLAYCTSHHLGKKWHIDLSDVLDELYSPRSRHFHNRILANCQHVRNFAAVKYIPALVVQEEDFHTICKQRSHGKPKPVLLHPFHQTLFNDDELPFALPQKAGQTHGRPEAFRLLSLTPFGTAQHAGGLGVDGVGYFQAALRKSMNGLAQEGVVVNGTDCHEEKLAHKAQMQVDRGVTVR